MDLAAHWGPFFLYLGTAGVLRCILQSKKIWMRGKDGSRQGSSFIPSSETQGSIPVFPDNWSCRSVRLAGRRVLSGVCNIHCGTTLDSYLLVYFTTIARVKKGDISIVQWDCKATYKKGVRLAWLFLHLNSVFFPMEAPPTHLGDSTSSIANP